MEGRIFGRYEVVAEIGKGAMGLVYKARDPMLDRMVAVKTILMLGGDREDEQRFYQEARAAGRLNHPNIVTIYDIGKQDDVAYMAMELIDGVELRQLMRNGIPLPAVQVIDIAIGAAEGLGYAHEHGVVHRDVKPSNIMILRGGRIKIMDFGIARIRESDIRTQTGLVLGSPRYMSPEQALGKRVDARSDIFSLGVILHEMLTGRPPFTGADVNAIIYQTVNVQPPPPTTLNTKVPAILDFIVAKALAKAPDERYARIQELVADLHDCRARLDGLGSPNGGAARAPAQADLTHLSAGAADAAAEEVPPGSDTEPPTLGLSRAFDSLDATWRLAKQTESTQEVEEFITTQRQLAYRNPIEGGADAAQPTGLNTDERLALAPHPTGSLAQPGPGTLSTPGKIGLILAFIVVLAIAGLIAFA